MKSETIVATSSSAWQASTRPIRADLVFYFGSRETLEDGRLFTMLRDRYPMAVIAGCSTGGQIFDGDVANDIATGVVVQFDETEVKLSVQEISDSSASQACGRAIGRELTHADLAGVFVLSDGLGVNGSELVRGIVAEIGPHTPLSGGLAGDGVAFRQTLVSGNEPPKARMVAAVGFYGSRLQMRVGRGCGWAEFGPRRNITRAVENVLYELDGYPALDLYEHYLGAEAADLPSSGQNFPLKISVPRRPELDSVRNILSIDRQARTVTFAGDVPQGWTAQLMRGRSAMIVAGAAEAARQAQTDSAEQNGLALLVSGIGRRQFLGQLAFDEIVAATAELRPGYQVLGFYSYGEIAAHAISRRSELHGQTMSITTITEVA
ncbi:MAG: FIST signal transduction protein [Geminicoccaceae bacterium]